MSVFPDYVYQRRRKEALDHGEKLCQFPWHKIGQTGKGQKQGGDPGTLRQVLARRRNQWHVFLQGSAQV